MDVQSVIVGAPPPSVQAQINGTGNGGDMISKQFVQTPIGQPNQQIAYIPVALALFARFGSLFFYTLSGELTAGVVKIIHLQTWQESVLVALTAAVVGLVFSLSTIFGNLEKKYPIVSQLT